MKNLALGAFISLLVAAAALQALAQSSDEQRGGDPPALAAGPGASTDACRPDVIAASGVNTDSDKAEFDRSTLGKELRGAGSAMANAVRAWEEEVGTKIGERWKAWPRATERSLECAHLRLVIFDRVICTIHGRPCESDTATAPAAQSDKEQAGGDAPRCHGIIAAVGREATSRRLARRAAEDRWMDRVVFDFGGRYADLNYAEEASLVCAASTPVSPAIIIKKTYFRCKIWARPCQPPDGAMAENDTGK
jgi:hypothetical protein